MTRSVWKGPFIDRSLNKIIKMQNNNESLDFKNNKPIKNWSRRSLIIPSFVGLTFEIYNGKKFIPILITQDMINHKFGEFSETRGFARHKVKDNKKSNKR